MTITENCRYMTLTKAQKQKVQIITVTAVALLVIMLIALIGNFIRLGALNKSESRLAKEIERNAAIIEDNDQTIAYRNTPAYIEQYAREVLGMKKLGEVVYESA